MAKGKSCRRCGMPMYAIKEDHREKGTWVTYQCTNGNCKDIEKVFEDK